MANNSLSSVSQSPYGPEDVGEPLFLAFAGGLMTCKVSVTSTRGIITLELDLSGVLTPEHGFVRDLITNVAENIRYDVALLRFENLAFFDGHIMNECALEQVLMLSTYFSHVGKPVYIHMENSCIKEALEKSFSAKRYGTIHFA